MTILALLIVLASAFLHAFWNLLLKRANSGMPFMWLIFVSMVVAYFPVAIVIVIFQHPVIGPREIVAMLGNGVLQLTYFYLLNQSYRFGDMSLVYPLARGSGPLIVLFYAVLVIGEQPTPLALAGAALIAFGVLLLSLNFKELQASGAYKGVLFALLTGASIATYTLWDRFGVRDLAIPPLLYLWVGSIVQMLITAPFALRNRAAVASGWRDHWKAAVAIGVISIGAYGLILFALTFSPVSYIAPAREVSTLVGSMMGGRILSEGFTKRRLFAAAAMVVGVIGLALG
jgi:drug/metabolite transporter (DMT)-like permease